MTAFMYDGEHLVTDRRLRDTGKNAVISAAFFVRETCDE